MIEMTRRGRPKILGYLKGGVWQAICGSHRIAAASFLQVPVTLVPVSPDEILTEERIEKLAGELLSDLPIGLTPREIIEERDRMGSGVSYYVSL
jgi:hypothetical protein